MIITHAGPEQVNSICRLLRANGLPLDGFPEDAAVILCALEGSSLIGGAALEVHGAHGLLRSVVVASDRRARGCGSALTQAILAEAANQRLSGVYLLTETATAFFAQQGFSPVARDEAPAEVRRSVEFTTACPDSAQAMRIEIGPAR